MKMAYKFFFYASFEKDLKAFRHDKKLLAEVADLTRKIIEMPEIGEALKGSWDGFTKYSFHRKPEMRILYVVYPCCTVLDIECTKCRFEDVPDGENGIENCKGLVEFCFVKTREDCNNLYAKSKKYAEGFLRE